MEEAVYSAIAESARLRGVTCSRDNVWPILTAFREALADAVIVFSMATDKRHAGELDYTITVPSGNGDPYALALSKGFVEKTDHPVGALLSDIEKRYPVRGYAIDCGVVDGFKKTYAFFPLDQLPALSKFADIPSMPPGVAANAGLFARYGLDDGVTMVGIDYRSRTMNVYFGRLPAGCLETANILGMLREIGLPEPGEEMLEFIQKSFSIYITLDWESTKIDRICFAVITADPMELPARISPEIEHFARNAPHAHTGNRILVYGSTLSLQGEYFKLGSYYQMPPETRKLLAAFDAIEDEA